jgi:hypothetical protein
MTHDNAKDALEYAAALLEQNDAGGTLPNVLRNVARKHLEMESIIDQLADMIHDDALSITPLLDHDIIVAAASGETRQGA